MSVCGIKRQQTQVIQRALWEQMKNERSNPWLVYNSTMFSFRFYYFHSIKQIFLFLSSVVFNSIFNIHKYLLAKSDHIASVCPIASARRRMRPSIPAERQWQKVKQQKSYTYSTYRQLNTDLVQYQFYINQFFSLCVDVAGFFLLICALFAVSLSCWVLWVGMAIGVAVAGARRDHGARTPNGKMN